MLGTHYYITRLALKDLLKKAAACRMAQEEHIKHGGTPRVTARQRAERELDLCIAELTTKYSDGLPAPLPEQIAEVPQNLIEPERPGTEL